MIDYKKVENELLGIFTRDEIGRQLFKLDKKDSKEFTRRIMISIKKLIENEFELILNFTTFPDEADEQNYNGELISIDEDVIGGLEAEIAKLKKQVTEYKEKADARFDEIIRLQRHSRMQNLR